MLKISFQKSFLIHGYAILLELQSFIATPQNYDNKIIDQPQDDLKNPFCLPGRIST